MFYFVQVTRDAAKAEVRRATVNLAFHCFSLEHRVYHLQINMHMHTLILLFITHCK